MKKNNKTTEQLIDLTAAQILNVYLTERYVSNPRTFNLQNFTIDELLKNSFEMSGDDFFCVYEKPYRLARCSTYANIKNYFHNAELISNGIDFSDGRICTVLSLFCKKYSTQSIIFSIELLLDKSFTYGSLIINKFLDVRFGQLGRPKKQKKFHLIGISTDYEIPLNGCDKQISTHGARIMKEQFSFSYASEKLTRIPAVVELATFVLKNFSHATADSAPLKTQAL